MEELADLVFFLENSGKDPTSLLFDDDLTGLRNRRFFRNFLEFRVQWGSLKTNPASLLMLDLDQLKDINDAHGRETGDAVLRRLGRFVQEAAGDKGHAIRYGGDEFVVLLPDEPKKTAITAGRKLASAIHAAPFVSEDGQLEIPFTVSVGIATAPEDAESEKQFMEKALAALELAKKMGGNHAVNAAEITPESESAETALHRDNAKNAGRKAQLAQVSASLKKFSQKASQLVLVEGGHGMGKSSFLETIHLNLSKAKIPRVKVSGITQELFRPYYLISNIVQELLNARKDKGGKVLGALDPVALAALAAAFMPSGSMRIHARQAEETDLGDAAQKREHIFNAMARVIPMLVENKPLIILVDDLHLADEASLLVLKHLFIKKTIPVFLCGTGPDTLRDGGDSVPLQRFVNACAELIDFETVRLTALSPGEIAAHFAKIYPGVKLPEGLCEDIAQVSQGNPLFFNGIMFKLVFDEKIRRADGKWVVDPIEEGYLPRSMDEIIAQKVASLDQESKNLLDRASAFGQSVSLSQLTGSTEMDEAKVLDFLDKAAAQGLVSSEFHMNDEKIRFLGNQVRQVIYGNIDESEKEKIHEHIGDYQESLYKRRLMPSPSILAYHYQRSANLEKARTYEHLQALQSDMIFNPQEASRYTGASLDPDDDAQAPDIPLAAEYMTQVPKIIRAFLISIRNTKLYPEGSDLTANAVNKFKETLEGVTASNPRLNIVYEKEVIYANGEPLELSEIKTVAGAFGNFMGSLELKGVAFGQEATLAELVRLIEGLSRVDPKTVHQRFWKDFSAENRLKHVQLRQVTYTQVSSGEEAAPAPAQTGEKDLDREEQMLAARTIKILLSAASKLKLYPADGPVASEALDQLGASLSQYLNKHPVMALAGVDQSLLLNGARVDAVIFEKLAPFMLKFLESAGLKSLTFFTKVHKPDLAVFLSNAGQAPAHEQAAQFWADLSREHHISTILFNQSVYDVMAEQIALDAAGEGGAPEAEDEAALEMEPEPPPPVEAQPDQDAAISLEPSLDNVRNLFLRGNENGVARVLEHLFSGYIEKNRDGRREVLEICQTFLTAPDLSPEPRFCPLVVDPLLAVLPFESDLDLLEELASLLYDTAQNFIRMGEYSLATWIFGHFAKKVDHMEDRGEGAVIPEALQRPPGPDMEKLLVEDVISGETFRQQAAFALIGGLGAPAVRLLIDIIKGHDDLRVRQIAATQIKRMGHEALGALKRELTSESSGKKKARIIDVIDTATTELRTELVHSLSDGNAAVRKAGLGLAERLDHGQVGGILLEMAKNQDPGVASDAITCMSRMHLPGATSVIAGLMDIGKDKDFLVACCQALGRMGEPEAIVPLSKILSHKKSFFSKKEYPAPVRAAAAFALAGIPHNLARGALAAFSEDADPRVREAARQMKEA